MNLFKMVWMKMVNFKLGDSCKTKGDIEMLLNSPSNHHNEKQSASL